MREGWSYKKLGEVVDKLTDGSHNPPMGIECSEYKMISSQNIQNGFIDMNAGVRYLKYEDFLKEDARTRVKYGDVLLTIVGTVGRCTVFKINDSITLQRSVAVMSPKPIINSDFLKFYFIAQASTLSDNAHGIAQKGLYLKQLSNFEVPVPPLPTQQQIVEELDLLSSIIEKQKAQLKELDSLAQSLFYDMFGDPVANEKGWEVKKLGEISKNHDFKRRPITAKDRIAGNIPYYGASGIVDYVNDFIFEGNFLLVSEDGANLIMRSTPIAFEITGKTWVNNHAHVLQFDDMATQKYVEFSINLRDISILVNGCAQPKLTQANLNNLSIPLPPLSLQQQFAERVESIEHQKTLVKQQLKETETLFNSRMDYYFN